MPRYQIHEVDGTRFEDTINGFNALGEGWPPLQSRHLADGYWWLAYDVDEDGPPVAFAGMVPFDPIRNVGYFKRCFVKPDHHGHGLQLRLMCARELKARQLGWTMVVSECAASNTHSANNFRRAGFDLCEPEQPWAKDSIYWVKVLDAK